MSSAWIDYTPKIFKRSSVSSCVHCTFNLCIKSSLHFILAVDVLRTHRGDSIITYNSFKVVVVIVDNMFESRLEAFAGDRLCDELLESLLVHADNDDIVRIGSQVVATIVDRDRSLHVKLGTPQGLEVVSLMLRKSDDDIELARSTLQLVDLLVDDRTGNGAVKLGDLGAGEMLVDIIRRYANDVDICARSLYILCNMSKVDGCMDRLLHAGLTESVVECMRVHFSSLSIAEYGCCVIGCIPVHLDPYLSSDACVDASERVVESLDRYCDNPTIAEQGLKSMSNLLACAGCVPILTAPSVCERAVKTMGQHLAVASVAEAGGLVIATLAISTSEVKKQLGSIGCCELLMDALTRHIEAAGVVRNCLKAIRILSSVKNNSTTFTQRGLLDHLVEALRIHCDEESVTDECLMTIILQAEISDVNISKLVQSGLYENVVLVLKQPSSNEKIIEECYKLICIFGSNDSSRGKLGSIGACEHIYATMKKFLKVGSLVGHACRAIAVLSALDSNRARFGQAGACELVVDAMRKHLDDPFVAENSCWAAMKLNLKNEENKNLLISGGIREGLNMLAQKHPGVPAVTEKVREAYNVFLG